ncbi:MAG: SDR family oxidoreductase [Deltaproteobacteria bacterium]|nr:SDR family oxidoreductase [Deltaproteobacteria bacterium]
MARAPIDQSVTLITGASSGIGEAIARQLAPRVRTMVLVARREARLRTLSEELLRANPQLIVIIEPCDISDLTACGAMLDRVERSAGPIDILINNAGIGHMALYEAAPWHELAAMIQLNVVALSYLTRRVIPSMVARRKGGILNISSGFGLEFLPLFAAYVGTKHYVTGLTEGLHVELTDQNIAVTQSCPGPVQTEFSQNLGADNDVQIPSLISLTAAQCAKRSLAAFERGRAMVLPGFLMKFMALSGALSPRWLKRWLYRWAMPTLRARAAKALTPETTS